MKSDVQIQTDVMDKMKSELFLVASEIGVAVKEGIVTLSGRVDSYEKKSIAENVVKNIAGVKALAEDIRIAISPCFHKTDLEIAEDVVKALMSHPAVKKEKMKIKIENGIVRLEGEVDCDSERSDAKAAVRNLAGVSGVINLIAVIPADDNLEGSIMAALESVPDLDASRITPEVTDRAVTLTGKTGSLAEKEAAVRVTASVPGVIKVEDKIEIDIPQHALEM